MSASLVAEYCSFKPSFPFDVATNRVNEAKYVYGVTTLLYDATRERVIVATRRYFVASARYDVASGRCSVA